MKYPLLKDEKVTILTPYFPTNDNKYGGIFVYDQTKVIAEYVKSVEVYVIRPWFKLSRKFPFISNNRSDLSLLKVEKNNVTLKLIRYLPFPKDSIFYHLSLAVSLFINKRRFTDKLLIHTIYPLGVALRSLKRPSAIIIHGSDFRYFSQNSKQMKVIAEAVTKSSVICVSKGLKQEVEHAVSNSKNILDISVIENGVEIKHKNSFSKCDYFNNKRVFRFIFVGSLIKLKGVYELLEAFSKLQNKSDQKCYSLTFVGEGSEKSTLESIVNNNSIQNVFFSGPLNNDKVMSILDSSDCLVLPSYQEGFGRVIIEMLSLGKPVIATRSGGPEFILNEDTGLIIPPKDTNALINAMENIHKNYNSYNSEKIKRYTNQKYCIRKQTLKLLNNIFQGID
ncbi:MAG: glycosyltransferase [Winogradskyella sp.]